LGLVAARGIPALPTTQERGQFATSIKFKDIREVSLVLVAGLVKVLDILRWDFGGSSTNSEARAQPAHLLAARSTVSPSSRVTSDRLWLV